MAYKHVKVYLNTQWSCATLKFITALHSITFVTTQESLTKCVVEFKHPLVFLFILNTYNFSQQILPMISFIAKQNKIYILINAIEKIKCQREDQCHSDGHLLFSSNFVFDRNGCVVSRLCIKLSDQPYNWIFLFKSTHSQLNNFPDIANIIREKTNY